MERDNISISSNKGGKSFADPLDGRNPYINYLRDFRKAYPGMSSTEQVRHGAKARLHLDKDIKLRYVEAACKVPIHWLSKSVCNKILKYCNAPPQMKCSCHRSKPKNVKRKPKSTCKKQEKSYRQKKP